MEESVGCVKIAGLIGAMGILEKGGTFCGDVCAPERLARVFACEGQADELLDHLVLISALFIVIELSFVDVSIFRGDFRMGR